MADPTYPQISPELKSGEETIHGAGAPSDMNLLGFWRWQGSQLVDNSMRGLLAEYYVAVALGKGECPRVEWDGYDCLTADGVKVEVKASGYIQSWPQWGLSKIQFNIAPKKAWQAETNSYSEVPKRQADVYVFCLHAHKNLDTLDPLDLSQWEFYVLSTGQLNKLAPTQKTITLSSLMKRFSPAKPTYSNLKQAVLVAAAR